MEIRDRIQRICLEHRRNYGYRRVRRELKNQGLIVNEKRVRRSMREDDLLAARRKKFVLTTASRHALNIFPNMAGAIKLDGTLVLFVFPSAPKEIPEPPHDPQPKSNQRGAKRNPPQPRIRRNSLPMRPNL